MKTAKIYKPAKTAMQSGIHNTLKWILEYEPEEKKAPDPMMGWAGSGDVDSQIRLKFDTREEAEDYARRNRIDYVVLEPHPRRMRIRTYADNFK